MLHPNIPTNFTREAGLNRYTAIDHVFLRGAMTRADYELVPTPCFHAGTFMIVSAAAGHVHPYAWKLFRWWCATEEE